MPDRPTHVRRPFGWAACLCLLAIAGCLVVPTLGPATESRETSIVRAIKEVRSSVVNIRGEKTLATTDAKAEIKPGRRVNGMGTGVVIDPRGYILTNYHVVDGVRQIQVTGADGKTLIARLVARDTKTDLAIVKIDPPNDLPVITLGTSSDLMPGETVLAVGNAYGYEHTVTRGIISALHRAVQVSDVQFYDDLIQTDASINPGNSGGPLLNVDGEMIGINVAVRAGAQGIGFAIPADKAMDVTARLLASYAARNAWHGMALSTQADASLRGLKVAAIERKSPAAASGLRAGDVITAVDDIKTRRGIDFHLALLQRKAGEKVELSVRRTGDPITVPLTLATVPKRFRKSTDLAWTLLGLELTPITTKKFREKHQTRYHGGLTVKAVRPSSPAAEQGIRAGDVLVGMHIWETVTMDNVAYVLGRPNLGTISPVKFYILRDKDTFYGYLPVALKVTPR